MLERLRMGRSFHHRPRAEARRTAGEAGGVSLYAETEAAKPTSRRAAPTCTWSLRVTHTGSLRTLPRWSGASADAGCRPLHDGG